MKKYIRPILFILLIILIFTLHVAAANLLPFPLNRLNVILLSAMWMLMFNKNDKIAYIFILSLISELFVSTPFGLNTAALLISSAALEWVLLNILTNRYFFMVFLTGIIGNFLFRVVFFGIFLLLKVAGLAEININQTLAINILIEFAMNAAALMIIYLISLLFVKRYNPKYVTDR